MAGRELRSEQPEPQSESTFGTEPVLVAHHIVLRSGRRVPAERLMRLHGLYELESIQATSVLSHFEMAGGRSELVMRALLSSIHRE